DAIAKCQHRDAAAFANRVVPPLRAATVDELVEFRPGNDALIGAAPGLVVGRRDAGGIGRLRATDLDQDRAPDMNTTKQAATLQEQYCISAQQRRRLVWNCHTPAARLVQRGGKTPELFAAYRNVAATTRRRDKNLYPTR